MNSFALTKKNSSFWPFCFVGFYRSRNYIAEIKISEIGIQFSAFMSLKELYSFCGHLAFTKKSHLQISTFSSVLTCFRKIFI